MKRIITFLIIILSNTALSQNLLPMTWKFSTGDDPAWSSASFDDSEWKDIIPGTAWENQGYAGYDGFAWYRVTFYVPSELREVAKKYSGFTLLLGKIDDVDETYLNGELLAGTGKLPPDYLSKWNVDRSYRIPARRILWDQPNTIAVRVFDLYGGGGIYGFPIQLSVTGLCDQLTMEPAFPEPDCILEDVTPAAIPLRTVNGSKHGLEGKMTVRVISDFGEEILDTLRDLDLEGEVADTVTFALPGIQPGFYKAFVTFSGELAYKQLIFGFGYEPEKIDSPVDARPDFAEFWEMAKQELALVKPRYEVTKIDSLITPRRNVYLVEMRSLGNVLIRGWYSVPAVPGKYPAIMQVPGYSGSMQPEYVDYGDDIIGFGLNIRGHGNSQDDINPGFPGFLWYGLQDKETYIYRGAYMDCIRGIDFLFSRPEVDTTRVAVEGTSQGGGLTFVTAALDNKRIKACAPQVPFLSDFEDYFKVAAWPGNEFVDLLAKEKEMTWDKVYNTLSYFDIKNLAGWIKAPMLMGVGLVDDVCPPHINFAAYNQVRSEKMYIVYPESGHGLPEDFDIRRMAFLREKLGCPVRAVEQSER